jgi:hypothetical protein
MEGPHRVIGNVLDGLADSVDSLGNGAVRTIEDVGESLMSALDKPFAEVTGIQGPHRAIDRAAKGAIDAGVNFASRGIIGSAKTAGEGLMKTLDHPLEQIGKGKFELPKIMKK